MQASNSSLSRLEQRLQEAYEQFCTTIVDPLDALFDGEALPWLTIGGGLDATGLAGWGPTTETQLREIRNQCRLLAMTNEFAINGHENRVSFIVGSGHTYRAAIKKGQSATGAPADWMAAVQAVLDEFVKNNCWQRRQQEIVLRRDRD